MMTSHIIASIARAHFLPFRGVPSASCVELVSGDAGGTCAWCDGREVRVPRIRRGVGGVTGPWLKKGCRLAAGRVQGHVQGASRERPDRLRANPPSREKQRDGDAYAPPLGCTQSRTMAARAVRDAVYSILSPRLRTDGLLSTEAQHIEDEITCQVMSICNARAIAHCTLALTVDLRRARAGCNAGNVAHAEGNAFTRRRSRPGVHPAQRGVPDRTVNEESNRAQTNEPHSAERAARRAARDATR